MKKYFKWLIANSNISRAKFKIFWFIVYILMFCVVIMCSISYIWSRIVHVIDVSIYTGVDGASTYTVLLGGQLSNNFFMRFSGVYRT